MERSFDTSRIFSGGNGMFLEYHDIVKPVWLYAVVNLIMNDYRGLPVNIIANMPMLGILEWYLNRRYRNPLKQLDWKHQIPDDELDRLLRTVLEDATIYSLAPLLQLKTFLRVYRRQSMVFPFFVYSDEFEPGIEKDVKQIFGSIPHRYVFGDLEKAIRSTDENFTYIFSDCNKIRIASKTLSGTCAHVLLADDYRYNYLRFRGPMKVDLREEMSAHPFIRIGTTHVFDVTEGIFGNITKGARNAADERHQTNRI